MLQIFFEFIGGLSKLLKNVYKTTNSYKNLVDYLNC